MTASSLPCLCGTTRRKIAFSRFPGIPSGTAKILRCGSCGLHRTDPSPLEDQAMAADRYQVEDYFLGAERDPGFWMRMQKPILEDLRAFAPGGRFLDVGCGMGFLTESARRSGYSATGVDLNSHAIEKGRRLFPDADIRCAGLDHLPDQGYDAVVLNHVIEHVVNPVGFLESVRKKLSPGGVLVIGVPNLMGGIPRLLRALNFLPWVPGSRWLWHGYQVDQHVWHFTPRVLEGLLEHNGWQVVMLRRNANMHYGALERGDFRYRVLKRVFSGFARAGQGDNLRVVCVSKSSYSRAT